MSVRGNGKTQEGQVGEGLRRGHVGPSLAREEGGGPGGLTARRRLCVWCLWRPVCRTGAKMLAVGCNLQGL